MNKILVCNQKMFLTSDEALELRKSLDTLTFENIDFIVCPSYLDFDTFKDYTLGAQNCFYEDRGAYTGEISAYQLYLKGIKYSIVGHLERRKYESLKELNLKVKACLRNSITPIICIGENKLDKEMRRVSETLKKQLTTILNDIKLTENQKIIIAYEPLWAIGSNNPITNSELVDTIKYIKKVISTLNIDNYNVIYGGSINKDTIESMPLDIIDGYIIGSSSTNIDELEYIIKCINSVK